MTLTVIFYTSGFAIIFLLFIKRIEEIRKKPRFIANIITASDVYVRNLYHRVVHYYSDGKEKTTFLVKKQIPIHSKNSWNKATSYLKEKREQYLVNMRDSKLLKKQDGLSEFFKSISNVEKGNGEIHDFIEDGSQEVEKRLE